MNVGPGPLEKLLNGLRAVAEPTRLRLLAVCAEGEWTVSELTQVMGQSQPRISRHLKVMADAGVLERVREGAWVFYRLARTGSGAAVALRLCELLPGDDAALMLDAQRLRDVRAAREAQADRYFASHAPEWDAIRSYYTDEAKVEAALLDLVATSDARSVLDIGTGTGRVLQICAATVRFGLGIDLSREMLAVARANLDRAAVRNCQVRHGNMYQLALPDASFDAAVLHQVLHFADRPRAALAEAARVLAPGGRLIVVDFAPHRLEFLRDQRAHRRLGFADVEMLGWFADLGLAAEPPVRLPGQPLTVVLWSARRKGRLDVSEDDLTGAVA